MIPAGAHVNGSKQSQAAWRKLRNGDQPDADLAQRWNDFIATAAHRGADYLKLPGFREAHDAVVEAETAKDKRMALKVFFSLGFDKRIK